MRELRKVMTKDSNVAVVAEAVHCTGALAQGLRSAYAATARGLVEVGGWGKWEWCCSAPGSGPEGLGAAHRTCNWRVRSTVEVGGGIGGAAWLLGQALRGWGLRTALAIGGCTAWWRWLVEGGQAHGSA